MRRSPILAVVGLIGLAASGLPAESKIGFRQLSSTTPVAVERGRKSVVKIRSNFTLDDAYEVFFDRPGIRAKFLETKPIAAPRRRRGSVGTPFRFELDVPADQPCGVYEVRVATKQAVSSVTHVLVTEYPVVHEQSKDNGAAESAQPVSVPCAIAGTCNPSEDVDFYRIEGKAGQRLTMQIYAQRATAAVHSMQCGNKVYLMDSILTLYGPNGQVVAQNDNYFGGDAFLHVELPADGAYSLEVRDARYVGDPKYVYCVEITDRPFVHATFPLAVQRGRSRDVQLVGHNLGGMQSANVSLTNLELHSRRERNSRAAKRTEPVAAIRPDADTTSIPTDGGIIGLKSFQRLVWKPLRFTTPTGKSNPVRVLVSDHRQVVADGRNAALASALDVKLPAGLNGRFNKPDQSHYYAFQARKGDYFKFEVVAARAGLPLDAVVQVRDANDRVVVEADDWLDSKDPLLRFQAKAAGRYFLVVRDLHDRGGERFLYHIRAELEGPDIDLHGECYYAQLAPGTNMMWFVSLSRVNGFIGPVHIHVEGLPEGVTYTPVTMPVGVHRCGLILSCAEDAEIDASLVRVYATAAVPRADGKWHEIKRYARITCELQTQGGGQARREINTQLVGVTKPLDLTKVQAAPEEIKLSPGTTAQIKVRIERSGLYKDPVSLAMAFKYFTTVFGQQLPKGVTIAKGSTARLTGEALEGKIILTASKDAVPVERLPIAVLARVSITFSITTNYASNPVFLTVTK